MSGLASFVGGVFDGMDWREQRDDRKRRREIDDKLMKRDDERFQWEQEGHEYTKSERARVEKERKRAEGLRDEELAIWGGVDGPSESGVGVTSVSASGEPASDQSPRDASEPVNVPAPKASSQDPATSPTPRQRQAEPTPAPGIKVSTLPPAPVARDPQGPPMPQMEPSFEEWQAMSRSQREAAGLPVSEVGGQWHYRNRDGGWSLTGTPDGPRVQNPEDFQPSRAPDAAPGAPRIAEVDPRRSSMVQDAQGLMRGGDISEATRAIGRSIPASSPFLGGIKDYLTETPEQGAKLAAERTANSEASEWYKSGDAVSHFSQNPDAIAAAAADPVGYFAARKAGPQTAAAVQHGGTDTMQPGAAPVTGNDLPPARTGAAEAVPTTPSGTPMVSVAAAQQVAESAPGVVGPGTGKPITKKQMGTATDALMDHVRTNVAPKLIEFYTKSGQIEKATAFAAFIDDASVKEGMKAWGRVVTSASIGDEKGFTDAIVEAYNAPGYYDDGYTAVPGQTRLLKDEKGNISGAVVSFKNDDTGEIFDKTFDDVGDLYEQAVQVLSPEAVFEQGYASHQQAVAYEQAIAKAKAEAANAKIDFKAVMDVVKTLGESSIEFQQLTPDEQVAKAIQFMSAPQGGGDLPSGGAPPGAKFGLGEVAVLR